MRQTQLDKLTPTVFARPVVCKRARRPTPIDVLEMMQPATVAESEEAPATVRLPLHDRAATVPMTPAVRDGDTELSMWLDRHWTADE
jgi:hypothetical protein